MNFSKFEIQEQLKWEEDQRMIGQPMSPRESIMDDETRRIKHSMDAAMKRAGAKTPRNIQPSQTPREMAPTILVNMREDNKKRTTPKTPTHAAAAAAAAPLHSLQEEQDPNNSWEDYSAHTQPEFDFDFLDPNILQEQPVSPPKIAQRVVLGVDSSDSEDEQERNAKKAKKGLFKWCYFLENHPEHRVWNHHKMAWVPVKVVSKYKEYLTL